MSTAKLPDPHTIYISPSGKRCTFVPSNGQTQWMFFRYMDNTELSGEGFPLAWVNFKLMRVHPQQRRLDAPAR